MCHTQVSHNTVSKSAATISNHSGNRRSGCSTRPSHKRDVAFGEFTDDDSQTALICLQKHEDIWTLDGVYVRRNRQVAADLDKRAREFAARYGILERRYTTGSDDATAALKRFTRSVFDW